MKAVSMMIAASAVPALANLQATLTPVDTQVDFATESFLVDYEVTNAGPGPVRFLPWKTPLDEVWEDLFLIHDADGNEIEYTGKIARRTPTLDEHYITMAEGETLSAQVDLTRSYLMPADGMVSVTLRHVNATGAPEYVEMNKVKMELLSTGLMLERFEATTGLSSGSGHGRKLAQSMQNCNSLQRSQVLDGLNIARNSHIPRAINCLGSSSGARCNRYATWFGAFTQARWNFANTCWANVRRDLPNAQYACCVGCGSGCGPNLFGFVYPSDRSMTIYLCNAYFTSDTRGRGETMTHEQTHFLVSCGTDDWAYGTSASMNLARQRPDRAMDNADNHCFFGSR
jgi:peptidyl-Lys metalloendopeptidase